MYWFAAKRTIKLGLKSLWMHKLRSTLTAIGIIFGVCSVIAMLAIGEGASREAQSAIKKLGSTNIILESVEPPEEQTDTGDQQVVSNYGLTYDDAESIRNTIADIEVTVPVRVIDQEARYRSRPPVSVKILGTVPWYTKTTPLEIVRGRFISSTDIHRILSVCVVDEQVADKLFAFEDPLGMDLKVMGTYYKVVGITGQNAMRGSVDAFDTSSPVAVSETGGVVGNIYIPLSTAQRRFSGFSFSYSSGKQKASKVELHKIIVKVASEKEVLLVRDILDSLLSRVHKKKDYQIIIPLELLRQAARTRRIFSIVLGSIAAISLLVGGIGIMNIMLATVSERTREIGIRRALGARKRDITIQFLSETVLMTLIGGVLGIIVGLIIPVMVTHFSKMPTIVTPLSLFLSFGISALVGVIFGLYPAYRAANMDPIESLRHE